VSQDSEVLAEDPLNAPAIHGSVLLSKEIKYYCTQVSSNEQKLIHPFNPDNLRPANYDLSLGEECQIGGKPIILSDDTSFLIIPAHQVAVVSTLEKINMPRFLIARWNLRVKLVYEGLLWVGGPQVDPGYQGKLYCPLYNLSNRAVMLRYKDPIFTIDFVRTTPFNDNDEEYLKFKPSRKSTLFAHDVYRLTSGPFQAFNEVQEIKGRVDAFQAVMLPLIALIFTSLAIIARIPFVVSNTLERPFEEYIQAPIFMLIITAIITFVCGWFMGKVSKR